MKPWAVAVALALAACRGSGDPEPLRAHGSIEARQVRVASRTSGRVLRVLVEENDAVVLGQPLVELDLADLEAQRDQARGAVAQAAARERLLVHGAQREDVDAARAALDWARVRQDAARRELARVSELQAGGAAAPRALDDARAAHDLAIADVAARRAQLAKISGGSRAEEIEAAAAGRVQAEAALAAVEERLRDRVLEAPLAGVVIHRMTEPGEVARPAAPLVVIGDLARPYLDVYVPEPRVADARPGARVEVRADAFPDRTFRGVVRHVASQAEFTPKNVQTEEQRARLVFRVRVDVEDPDGLLRPGMPGVATFAPAGPRPATDGGSGADGGPPAPEARGKS